MSIQIGGKTVEYARLAGWKCRWGCSGMLKRTGGYEDIPMPDTEPTADELLRYKAEVDPWQERVKMPRPGFRPAKRKRGMGNDFPRLRFGLP